METAQTKRADADALEESRALESFSTGVRRVEPDSVWERSISLGAFRYVLASPVNVGFLVTASLYVLLNLGFFSWVGLVALDALFAFGFSRFGAVQRQVERRIELLRRMKAAEARACLLMQMEEHHREELERIEALLDLTDAADARSAALALYTDGAPRLKHLAGTYIRLAILDRRIKTFLGQTNKASLLRDIEKMAHEVEESVGDLRVLSQHRLEIAKHRLCGWQRTEQEAKVVAGKLQEIEELVRLLHERVQAPVLPAARDDEVTNILDNIGEHESTATEISQLGAEPPIDVEVLELGRHVPGF